ncbi:AraC family transcriptional regulator [Rhizorhabdus dicambivorans]|nr:helix-turn-helix transcriptional regulator [Rhizorhabdus dicambivorans]
MLEGYTVFVHPAAGANLPAQCCALAVTPLLREMIIRAASFPVDYPDGGREERLVALLLDEISVARVERLHLPMPNDIRLRAIVAEMLDNPAKMRKMSDWARHIGMSERTMARILSRETGMGFRRWRQQLAVLLAVEWLARGSPIQQVAADLGYESAPSFVTMFRKALGTPPRRYMSRRSQRH